MARRSKELSKYECVVYGGCTIHIENPQGDGTIEQLFKMNDGDVPYDQCMIEVPAGTIVCKHFEPYNDQAHDDRDAQMEEPAKFVETDKDVSLLAEVMVKKGFFTTTTDACKAIQDEIGDKELTQGDDAQREALIKKLSSLGSDDKETRQKLNKVLKDGGITGYFKGAMPMKLAELVVENELHEGVK